MTNSKLTKRSLLTSSISLLLCFAMLLGTTFAWFTDSVTSSNNIIKSGNLDVELYYQVEGDNDWTKVDSNTNVFKENALWEPGYTEVVKLKVVNEGSLALKYKLGVSVASETGSVNVGGEEFKLSSYIKYGIVDGAQTYTRDEAITAVDGTATALNTAYTSDEIKLLSANEDDDSDEKIVTMVVYMPTSVGNEANHDKDADAPVINLGINLLATQLTYEKDSFDDQYDVDATYPFAFTAIDVDSNTTFADISNLLAEGKSICATENITIKDPANGNTNIQINGDVHIIADNDAVITFGETTLIRGDGTLTVHSGNLKTNYELCVTGDSTMIIEGGTHSFGAFSATSNGKIVVNGGTLNCRGTYAGVLGISFGENGQLIVNDGTLNMYQPFNLNPNRCDNAYVEINGGKINLPETVDKLFAVRNIMDKDRESGVLRGSSIRINGGTFTAEYPVDDTGDANAFIRNEDGNCDSTRVLASNTYNGQKDYDCIVSGGTFYGNWMRTGETGGDGTEVCENTIAGFVANGYQMTGDSTNGYVVSAK